jgi:hypothetical protein
MEVKHRFDTSGTSGARAAGAESRPVERMQCEQMCRQAPSCCSGYRSPAPSRLNGTGRKPASCLLHAGHAKEAGRLGLGDRRGTGVVCCLSTPLALSYCRFGYLQDISKVQSP